MKRIDLRSDTVTLPSEEMLDAMRNAKLGDDVYSEDPTVTELQEKAAKMFEKEAALLVCSGTMGNVCCVVGQTTPGDEIILERNSHIVLHEVASAAVIGGLQLRTVQGIHDYLITPEMLVEAVRGKDVHYPISSLVSIENTHNMAGGIPWKLEEIRALIKEAKKNNLKIHMDGARVFNASIATGIPVNEITKEVDTVMFCLSKGLACPIGSLIVGSQDFIDRALRVRKMLGGGMRQAGIIAAPGLVALDKMITRLADDHKNAKLLQKRLSEIPGIKTKECQTNILFIDIKGTGMTGLEFKQKLEQYNIIVSTRWDTTFRFVTHYGIEEEDVSYIINAIHSILSKTK
ncbi:MAG: DegT/DnrJ/EryC1/StrS family aminotransferase [Candidatus Heimdallarchaeota archaeon]|nr:DegT/DnrJ/EryC1/StrS family aminotransferase [Candidatus Heimdallarchaeota archaeon]